MVADDRSAGRPGRRWWVKSSHTLMDDTQTYFDTVNGNFCPTRETHRIRRLESEEGKAEDRWCQCPGCEVKSTVWRGLL